MSSCSRSRSGRVSRGLLPLVLLIALAPACRTKDLVGPEDLPAPAPAIEPTSSRTSSPRRVAQSAA